jgi:hypothetical protein
MIDSVCVSDILWISNSFSPEAAFNDALKEIFLMTQHFIVKINALKSMSILSQTMTSDKDTYSNPAQDRGLFAGGLANFLKGKPPAQMSDTGKDLVGWNDTLSAPPRVLSRRTPVLKDSLANRVCRDMILLLQLPWRGLSN